MFWIYIFSDLNGEEIVGTFTKDEFRSEKVIQRKGDKLYLKWKGSNNSFSSWIDKKGIVIYKSYFSEPYTPSKKNKS